MPKQIVEGWYCLRSRWAMKDGSIEVEYATEYCSDIDVLNYRITRLKQTLAGKEGVIKDSIQVTHKFKCPKGNYPWDYK